MSTVVSVLCARVRMEEKWLIEALAEAGVPARPLPPTLSPLPVGPVPGSPFATKVGGGVAAEVTGIVVDRCADRVLAGGLTPALRAMGVTVIDAGIAATGNRLAIASVLANGGIARPETLLVTSEDVGMVALRELGYPSTLLPLEAGSPEIPFYDRDIAEAVLEHRQVLGSTANTLALIQAGASTESSRLELLVVGGRVVAIGDASTLSARLELSIEEAERAASLLGAAILGVTVIDAAAGPVVWDVKAVPDFRSLIAVENGSTVAAIVELVKAYLTNGVVSIGSHVNVARANGFAVDTTLRREAGDGVVLSA